MPVATSLTGDPLAPLPEEPPPDPSLYTCPMHPEVKQPEPGTCPVCGMKLERGEGRHEH
jgi:hypothetical protein